MKASRTIFWLVVIVVACGVLWYMARSTVSQRIIPSLDEYVASSTNSRTASSTPSAQPVSSLWMASSTIVTSLLSGDEATATSATISRTSPRAVAPPVLATRSTLSEGYIRTPKGIIRLLIAKTPAARERGLSGYSSLASDQGMLFIFPKSGSMNFWMKDMNFPIDIVWMNRDRTILGVTRNLSPESYPKTFSSPENVQFVLELNAGSADTFGLRTGTALMF